MHLFFRAIFKASDTQHNKASDTQHNLNEHTLKGGGKSTDTHRSKIKGLKLSAAKKCKKETFISDNLQGFPGATLQMEWGVAFVTFNPWGIIQVKIHRLSAREMLVLQMLWREGNHTANNTSPVKICFLKSLPPGIVLSWVMVMISHFMQVVE